MKRTLLGALVIVLAFTLASCASQVSVVCGEGTYIKDGQCVAANVNDDTETPTDNDDNTDNTDNTGTTANCDSITGTVFYEVNFNDLSNSIVSNETGDLHNQNNFVVWGKGNDELLASQATVSNGILTINGLDGTQLDQFHNTGLGYQYFDYENDHTYTVCTVVEGPTGQSIYSEIGIFYGFGTKDEVVLEGTPQVVIQDFRPTLTTNTDRGQYIIFMGNVTGELKVHSIKIVVND